MNKRISISLPASTVELLDRASDKGNRSRSRMIDDALRYFIGAEERARIRAELKEGAIRHFQRDREINEEWSQIDPAI